MARTRLAPLLSPRCVSGVFTRYQEGSSSRCLPFLQFTIVLDFMIMGPLGAILLPALQINTQQFGLVVSAYAFSAGRLRAPGGRFRRSLRSQAVAPVFLRGVSARHAVVRRRQQLRLLARRSHVTGLFGGVIGSGISMAIVADSFPLEVRGRVWGRADGVCRQPGDGCPAGHFPFESLGLARPLHLWIPGLDELLGRLIHRRPPAANASST